MYDFRVKCGMISVISQYFSLCHQYISETLFLVNLIHNTEMNIIYLRSVVDTIIQRIHGI